MVKMEEEKGYPGKLISYTDGGIVIYACEEEFVSILKGMGLNEQDSKRVAAVGKKNNGYISIDKI